MVEEPNKTLKVVEVDVLWAQAFTECLGTERHNRDVMLTFTHRGHHNLLDAPLTVDCFLDKSQAREVIRRLENALAALEPTPAPAEEGA